MGKNNSKLEGDVLEQLTADTYFLEKEIKQWHKGFMEEYPNGRITEQGFIKIYTQFFTQSNDPSKFAAQVFRMFDENKDGSIEFEEFLRALSVTSRGSIDEKLHWAFQLYDADSDGFITHKEMYDVMDAVYRMEGNCPIENGVDILEKRVNEIFEQLDKDNDDKLTFEEFEQASKLDSTIVRALSIKKPPDTPIPFEKEFD